MAFMFSSLSIMLSRTVDPEHPHLTFSLSDTTGSSCRRDGDRTRLGTVARAANKSSPRGLKSPVFLRCYKCPLCARVETHSHPEARVLCRLKDLCICQQHPRYTRTCRP